MGLGYTLQDACDEVGILLASFMKWKNQGKKQQTKDKDK
jgi:hypothetical protein